MGFTPAPGPQRPPPSLADTLAQGLAELQLNVAGEGQAALLGFIALMEKWNRVYNLTAVRSRREMLIRHVLDSVSLTPHIQGPRVLDVGSGPGLPGIPLAVVLPEIQFTLLDAVAKKTRFIIQAVGELGLGNVAVEHSRVQSYEPGPVFDTVVSRAFSDINQFISLAGHLCRPGGQLLAMKARDPERELGAIPAGFTLEKVCPLQVPRLDEARCVVVLHRNMGG